MSFDCTYRRIPITDAVRLTRDAIAAAAHARGLGSAYVVAGLEVVRHRWRRRTVDVVVHMADGEDTLAMQFPDEARAAVTAAVNSLARARPGALRRIFGGERRRTLACAVICTFHAAMHSWSRSSPRPPPSPLAEGASRRASDPRAKHCRPTCHVRDVAVTTVPLLVKEEPPTSRSRQGSSPSSAPFRRTSR